MSSRSRFSFQKYPSSPCVYGLKVISQRRIPSGYSVVIARPFPISIPSVRPGAMRKQKCV